jgi:hypothetical protein
VGILGKIGILAAGILHADVTSQTSWSGEAQDREDDEGRGNGHEDDQSRFGVVHQIEFRSLVFLYYYFRGYGETLIGGGVRFRVYSVMGIHARKVFGLTRIVAYFGLGTSLEWTR